MNEEFPLYPELSEEGCKEAQKLIDKFKEQMKKATEDVLGELYVNVVDYIESDSWGNFRNEIMDGFKNYDNRKIQGAYDFKEIRQAMYKEFKEDIDKDLNQDLLEEVKSLKEHIELIQKYR